MLTGAEVAELHKEYQARRASDWAGDARKTDPTQVLNEGAIATSPRTHFIVDPSLGPLMMVQAAERHWGNPVWHYNPATRECDVDLFDVAWTAYTPPVLAPSVHCRMLSVCH